MPEPGRPREGRVVLGVHAEDEEMVEQAAGVLAAFVPERLAEFDIEGARRL